MFGFFKRNLKPAVNPQPVSDIEFVNAFAELYAIRREKIEIKLKLNKALAQRHDEAIKLLMGHHVPDMVDGDTLDVLYTFNIDYFGNVVQKFEALIELLNDPEIVLDVDVQELLYGRSVILHLAHKIEQMVKILRERSSHKGV